MDITIVGAGFAAVSAIRQIRKQAPQARIQLIAPDNTFIYYPSLIWLPSGLRNRGQISQSLTAFFNKQKVDFIKASATGIADAGRTVLTDVGNFSNDALLIASGGRFSRALSGIENALMPCCGVEPSEQLATRLAAMHAGNIVVGAIDNALEPAASRGMGPILEYLFGIDSYLRQKRIRDKFKLTFIQENQDYAWQFGAEASAKFTARMHALGIETLLGQPIKSCASQEVNVGDSAIAADLILMQTPMVGAPWLDDTDLPRSAGGLIKADKFAQIEGFDKCYAAGDVASFVGDGCPDWQMKLGFGGELQAKAAAQNLLADLGLGKRSAIKFELVYVIDALNSGTLIKRNPKGGKILPPLLPLHYGKRILESVYLRKLS